MNGIRLEAYQSKNFCKETLAEVDASIFDLRKIAKETGITFKNNSEQDLIELNKIANDRETGFNVLHYLAHHQNVKIRESVAWNQNTLPATLKMFWENKAEEVDVLGGVACNSNTPIYILREAVHSEKGQGYVAYCTALYRGGLPDDIAKVLLDSVHTVTLESLAENPTVPEFVYSELVKLAAKYSEPNILRNLVNNASCPAPILMSLIKDDYLAEDIAQHPNTPILGLTYLAKHPKKEIRNNALHNTNLPQSVRMKQKSEVRNADREASRKAILSTLLQIESLSSEGKKKLAEKEYLDVSIASILSLDDSPDVRMALAENPITPIKIIERLAQDEDIDVLITILNRDSLPDYITGFIMDSLGSDVEH